MLVMACIPLAGWGLSPSPNRYNRRIISPMSVSMPVQLFRHAPTLLVALACLVAAGCQSIPDKNQVISKLSPYKIDIVQGNVVTREQAALIRPGMPRSTVRDILGSPLLASVFHAQRWDYVFTLHRQGAPDQTRHVTVVFKDELVDSVDADDLPSESEFVSTLKSPIAQGERPAMVASEESLKKFLPAAKPVPSTPPASAAPNPAVSYPPLESTGN
jgi:outer membrane protein assembly factor BamE